MTIPAAPSPPADVAGLDLVSVAPDRLYGEGGFMEGDRGWLPGLVDASVTGLYPAFGYRRPEPAIWPHDAERDLLLDFYRGQDRAFARGPATVTLAARDVVLANSVVHLPGEAGRRVIYESYRLCDRPAVSATLPDTAGEVLHLPEGPQYVHLGSPGSFNYGHWLVDDLTRVGAAIDPSRERVFLIPDYGAALGARKAESLKAVLGAAEGWSIRWVDPARPLRLPEAVYTTPPTYHPMMKSPDAMAWLRDVAGPAIARGREPQATAAPPRRLFVGRGAGSGRALRNQAEIAAWLAHHGFVEAWPHELGAGAQAWLFSNAEIVVGAMGAGMTNTVFTPPGAQVVHLAPTGWREPFYWDLAAVMGHRYAAVYGPRQAEVEPSWADYEIGLGDLEQALQAI